MRLQLRPIILAFALALCVVGALRSADVGLLQGLVVGAIMAGLIYGAWEYIFPPS